MRAVKGYSPPADVDDRFAAVCREALPGLESGVDLKAVRLEDDAEKGKLAAPLPRDRTKCGESTGIRSSDSA